MVKLTIEWITVNIMPRVLKAAIWGSITFFIVYYLPSLLYPQDLLPPEYSTALADFAIISISFTVIGQLLSGTIIGCGFGIARALILIGFFFSVADGGIFSMTVPVTEVVVNVTVDITTILLMIVSVNLFDIAKNILEAISILDQKNNKIDFEEF
jgi:hypothetical protein